jgi:hypothetical protein
LEAPLDSKVAEILRNTKYAKEFVEAVIKAQKEGTATLNVGDKKIEISKLDFTPGR